MRAFFYHSRYLSGFVFMCTMLVMLDALKLTMWCISCIKFWKRMVDLHFFELKKCSLVFQGGKILCCCNLFISFANNSSLMDGWVWSEGYIPRNSNACCLCLFHESTGEKTVVNVLCGTFFCRLEYTRHIFAPRKPGTKHQHCCCLQSLLLGVHQASHRAFFDAPGFPTISDSDAFVEASAYRYTYIHELIWANSWCQFKGTKYFTMKKWFKYFFQNICISWKPCWSIQQEIRDIIVT